MIKRYSQTKGISSYKRPTKFYGTECWAVESQCQNKSSVEVIRMMCWMRRNIRRNIFMNDSIRRRVGVALIVVKTVESRLRWFVHI